MQNKDQPSSQATFAKAGVYYHSELSKAGHSEKGPEEALAHRSVPLVVSCQRLCYQRRREIHIHYFTPFPAWCFQVCSLAPAFDFSQ